jgi:uncharacterized Ntn-hydrolase superfamily protein
MTLSIVGRSNDGASLGVAVASKFLAVGAAVPAAKLSAGALATQAFCNTLYKRDGLALLTQGNTATQTLELLLADDELAAERQVGIVDTNGGSATHTGSGCLRWAGGLAEPNVAIQGNILTGAEVIEEMRQAWYDSVDIALPERLVSVLAAGDAAGGDARGRQSASLLVVSVRGGYTPGDDLAYDLRVDDHVTPIKELSRLLELHHVYFDSPDPDDLIPLEGETASEVDALLEHIGQPDLETWAGIENYELRLVAGQIDRFVLEELRRAAKQDEH